MDQNAKRQVRTRFAPSPTGEFHIGGARTAIFSWLLARHFQGKFLLRIEDTDKQREKAGATEGIIAGLKWLGLDWDEEILYQSQRLEIYRRYLQELQAKNLVYCCNCSAERLEHLRECQLAQAQKPKYDQHCRDLALRPEEQAQYVLRFKTPLEGESVFYDLIRGEIRVNNCELDDLVLWRSQGGPTYNFCVVVDDWLSGITHVVRGEDHINNTHRQQHLARALGAAELSYAHVPMILDEQGKKLSKRFSAVGVLSYKESGFLPEALFNYLVKLGWGYGDQELFTRTELIEKFAIEKVKSSPAALNLKKLEWLNRKYIQSAAAPEALAELLKPSFLEKAEKKSQHLPSSSPDLPSRFFEALALYRTRAHSLDELSTFLVEFFFPSFDFGAAKKIFQADQALKAALEQFQFALERLPQPWNELDIQTCLQNFAAVVGDENRVRLILREVLLSRANNTPPVKAVLLALGPSKSIARIALHLAACHADSQDA